MGAAHMRRTSAARRFLAKVCLLQAAAAWQRPERTNRIRSPEAGGHLIRSVPSLGAVLGTAAILVADITWRVDHDRVGEPTAYARDPIPCISWFALTEEL